MKSSSIDSLSMLLDSVKIIYIRMYSFDLDIIIGFAAMLSISGEFIHRGDDFMHIESPYILY